MSTQSSTPSPDPVPSVYLGDAVYACYARGMIGLSLDHHAARPVVWLEPQVLNELFRFAERMLAKKQS